jgi:polysaccharide pyruvyl transferase WcaK-like protein
LPARVTVESIRMNGVSENRVNLLVEPSDYILRNLGDMAMMHVAISRLARLWPYASIQVLTRDPTRLSAFCPKATPLFLPEPTKFAAFFRQRILVNRDVGGHRLWSHPRSLLKAISRADAVIVTGMGGVTDAFPKYAEDLLDRLEVAIRSRKPVIMFGQGMGPLKNPGLRAKAMSVLPRTAFISLREGRSSVPLLHSLGVDPGRLMVTGDDAIELAAASTASRLGNCFGINLRAANYANIGLDFVIECGEVLRALADTFGAPVVPISISSVPGEEDAITISKLMCCTESDVCERLDSPFAIIERIKRCRIVFTGSYHAAVFALSMGISTVCFARSDYYHEKFVGLADLFHGGCKIVSGHEANWRLQLVRVLEGVWHSADEVRPRLLEAARRQILWSRAAYQRAYRLLNEDMHAELKLK